jgi:hypothetical protein
MVRSLILVESTPIHQIKAKGSLLLSLEVVEQNGALLGLLTPVLDDDARAVDDLAGVTLAVELACFTRKEYVSPHFLPIKS